MPNQATQQYDWLMEVIKAGNAMASELANMPLNDYCQEHGRVPCRCKMELNKLRELWRQQANYWHKAILPRMNELFLIKSPDEDT